MKRSVLFYLLLVFIINSSVMLSARDDKKSGLSRTRNFPGFKTDLSQAAIDLDQVLSGGPGKDGIPALKSPAFVGIGREKLANHVLGILIEHRGVKKFYPYNILVWHEIVNDSIEDLSYAITFCPLCGSAIVYNRQIKGRIVNFGVSGMLYQSNLLMYDDWTESLWSQSRGEAVIGQLTGVKLQYLKMQLMSYEELQKKHPRGLVLSRKTGFQRDYDFYPYGDYLTNNRIYFPISVQDRRFPLKEMMYILPLEQQSIAIPLKNIRPGKQVFKAEHKTIVLEKQGEEINAYYKGRKIAAYYEMWFSWAIHHQENGIVLD